jgi:hypothetical protein
MEAKDLKEIFIPLVGLRYEAIEEGKNFKGTIKVYGSIGWKVWVETDKENGGKRLVCINPKNEKKEMLIYTTSEMAIRKANYFLKQNFIPAYAL